MKIIQLKAQNIKNLKAIEISPDGNIVRITGKNGAGKSAILDTILTSITGKKLEDIVRHGQDRAESFLDMGEFKVRRIWTEKGERLEVFTEQGDKKQSPQTFLDGIIGKLSFDPLAFSKLKATDQRGLLKDLVGLDFTDIENEIKKVYDERTSVNVEIKGVIAQLKNAEPPDPKVPEDELTFKAELEKINRLRDKKKAYEHHVGMSEGVKKDMARLDHENQELEDQIKEIQERIAFNKNKIKELNKSEWLQSVLPERVTEEEIIAAQTELESIEQKNVQIRSANRYRRLIKDGEKLKQEADKFTQALERLDQDKATRIANAKMPIDGLSMSDDAVVFNGIPFSRLSTGQQIRISTAIAMKLNPTVKIILIREGSLLDEEGKKEIFNIAKENDYQVWMEEVDEIGKTGFFIEDGSIKSVNGEEVKKSEEEDAEAESTV